MSTTVVQNTELIGIKQDIYQLKGMMQKLLLLVGAQVQKKDDLSADDLMRMASQVFEVTSKRTADDDNIAQPGKIKPVDFSSYA